MDFEPFLQYLDTQRRCSSQTIRAYRNDLTLFDAFLRDRSIFRISKVDHVVINDFIATMRERPNPRFGRTGLLDASIARRLAAVSSYFEFMRATSDAQMRNPIKNLSRRWQKNKEPKPVDELVLDLVITGISNLRDRTLFTLFLASGLRISEMHQLNRNSIRIEADDLGPDDDLYAPSQDHITGSGEVVGKGNKRRAFYVDEDTLLLYSKYLATRTDEHPALFLSERKTSLSVRAIQYTLTSWCKKLGAPHINVHRLRHSYATRLANANVSSMVLMKLMGHANPSTTMGYFKLTDTTLARGYFSAMEHLKR